MSLRVIIVAALIAGCGSTVDEETLCSDAPIATQGSFVTEFACGYEQQTYNIQVNGTLLHQSGLALRDGTGATVGTVQYSCGRYLLGKDPKGVAVIFNSSNGTVQSHGNVHPGFAVSSLPRVLQTPLKY
jgi:hypothetical protein